MLRLSRSTVVVCFVWICLFSGPAIAAADVITACVNPAGQLRLTRPESGCRSQERLVVWNEQGPEGPQGEQGPEGPRGPDGPQGPAG